MHVTTIGLDLAKNVFQVHEITKVDEVAFNRPLRRAQLLSFFSKLEPCLIGMEACTSSSALHPPRLKPSLQSGI